MPDPNIIGAGFMGAGKTVTGQEVAARLGRRERLVILNPAYTLLES